MTRSLALLLTAFSAAGCSLTSLAERDSAIAVNHCDKDTPCPSGSCNTGRCVADTGSFSTLLFALSSSTERPAGQQLFRTASVPKDGGNFPLDFDGVASVAGRVQATVPAGCEEATTFKGPNSIINLRWGLDHSIPARLSFYPVERMLGLPTSSQTVLVDLSDASGMQPPSYPFHARLAAGKYDVYIEPFDITVVSLEPAPAGCAIPPELIRGAVFDGSVQFEHSLPLPKHLDLKINWSDRASTLDHWRVDMLEPATGRVISTRAELSLPTNTDNLLIYSVGIDYLPVLDDQQQVTGNEIVRLSPPESVIAPAVLFQRSALELFAKGLGMIDQLAAIPKPISFEGQVIDAQTGNPVSASVTLTATELLGMPAGTLASFTRSTQTKDDGTFEFQLLPGNYRVLTVPVAGSGDRDAPLASSELSWKIAASPEKQAGRAVALSRARALTGAVFTPSGDVARGALINVEPSPGTITTDVFARALGALPLVPRGTSAVVDDSDGSFTVYADPGVLEKPNLFDLSVRPPAGSSFPWLLLPRRPVASDSSGDVGTLYLPTPVELDLSVEIGGESMSEGLLTGSSLRVYALLDAEGKPTNDAALAKSAVTIAESSLDASARASVWLPPALGQL